MDKKILNEIKKDFKSLNKEVLGIVIFGSHAKGENCNNSDIDICIIAPSKNSYTLFKKTLSLNYDIKIFESLPLYLKHEVIQNHIVVYSRNLLDLYEYFYGIRKLWDDQKYRQKISRKEAMYIFS